MVVLNGPDTLKSFKSFSERKQELEKLVAIFDGKINSIWPEKTDMVDIIYTFPKSIGHYSSIDLWPLSALKAKNIKIEEGFSVKVGIFMNNEGYANLAVLTDKETEAFSAPQTEVEKLQQRIAIYQIFTKNRYVPYFFRIS
jgi:hypothetical protein